MPIFDLKHAFYAAAGAVVGAITGYLLGIVLYIIVLCSGVFTDTSTPIGALILALTTSAGVYPLLFAFLIGALGFFAGWYMSHTQDEQNKPSTFVADVGPNLATVLPDILEQMRKSQGQKKQEDGPPAPT